MSFRFKIIKALKALAKSAPHLMGMGIELISDLSSGFTKNDGEVIPVTGVWLNKEKLILKKGDAEVLIPTIIPENATNKALTWKSSNSGVALAAGGVVTGLVPGAAIIIATAKDGSGVSVTCAVIVLSMWQRITKFARPSLWK